MKPYFPGNRLREICLSRNIVAKLSAEELMRMYSMFGVVMFTEYYSFNDTQRIFAGHPDFDELAPGQPIPKFMVEIRQTKRNRRPYKLFKLVKAE